LGKAQALRPYVRSNAQRLGRCPLSHPDSKRRLVRPGLPPPLTTPADGVRDSLRSEEWNTAVIQRLQYIAGSATFREIGARTVTHPESVRRYMTYGHPSVEFIAAFCLAFGTSADWILNGLGKSNRPSSTIEAAPGPTKARGITPQASRFPDNRSGPSSH
jgi:hypothetical protein